MSDRAAAFLAKGSSAALSLAARLFPIDSAGGCRARSNQRCRHGATSRDRQAIARRVRCSSDLVATRRAFVPDRVPPPRFRTARTRAQVWPGAGPPQHIVSGATRRCRAGRPGRISRFLGDESEVDQHPADVPADGACSSFAFSSCSWVIAPCRSKAPPGDPRGGRG